MNEINKTNKEGVAHGKWVDHWGSGKVFSVMHFVNGKHEGLSQMFFESGNLFYTSYLSNDVSEGEEINFNY